MVARESHFRSATEYLLVVLIYTPVLVGLIVGVVFVGKGLRAEGEG